MADVGQPVGPVARQLVQKRAPVGVARDLLAFGRPVLGGVGGGPLDQVVGRLVHGESGAAGGRSSKFSERVGPVDGAGAVQPAVRIAAAESGTVSRRWWVTDPPRASRCCCL